MCLSEQHDGICRPAVSMKHPSVRRVRLVVTVADQITCIHSTCVLVTFIVLNDPRLQE